MSSTGNNTTNVQSKEENSIESLLNCLFWQSSMMFKNSAISSSEVFEYVWNEVINILFTKYCFQ